LGNLASEAANCGYDQDDSTVSDAMENPHYSVVMPIAMFLLALAVSNAVTPPIGDVRRHIAAALLSLALGATGGFVTAEMAVSVFVAFGGAFVGMMLAWRRPHPPQQRETQCRPKHQASRRPRYGISRA